MTVTAFPLPTENWRPSWRRVDTAYGPMIVNRFDQYIGWSLMGYGEFSGDEADFLRGLVMPGDVVLDIGANIGALTLPVADKVGPTGRVHAFEPQPEVLALLVENVGLCCADRVTVHACGVGAVEGEMVVPPLNYDDLGNFGGISLQSQGEGTAVPIRSLDQLEFDRVDLIKVDVEGMETEVMVGGYRTIMKHRPILYVENDRPNRTPDLVRTLKALNYGFQQHNPSLYRAKNYFGNPINLFDKIVSLNLLCYPK